MPIFRNTSSMAISQLLGLHERVEEVEEGRGREDEAEDGFEGHGVLLSFASDLVAALHVPERQREEAGGEEEEEDVEHSVLLERRDRTEDEELLVVARVVGGGSAERVGGRVVVTRFELEDELRVWAVLERERPLPQGLGETRDAIVGVVEVLGAEGERRRDGEKRKSPGGYLSQTDAPCQLAASACGRVCRPRSSEAARCTFSEIFNVPTKSTNERQWDESSGSSGPKNVFTLNPERVLRVRDLRPEGLPRVVVLDVLPAVQEPELSGPVVVEGSSRS